MNLEKINVCAYIWRTEINYLENKNGHGWVQLWWTACNWGRGGLEWKMVYTSELKSLFISQASKKFRKFFGSYFELLSKFGEMSFQYKCVSEGISHPVFYGDLVYKLRRVKFEPNFISSGSKIIKRLDVERKTHWSSRTICLVLGPSTSLYRSFLRYWTPTNKVMGTGLVKTSEETRPLSSSPSDG